MEENENITELDLKHYKATCKGCQFVNLKDWNYKCPYFSHPKFTPASSNCFFKEYATLEGLYETKKFIESQNSKMPKVIKMFLDTQQIIQENRYQEAKEFLEREM